MGKNESQAVAKLLCLKNRSKNPETISTKKIQPDWKESDYSVKVAKIATSHGLGLRFKAMLFSVNHHLNQKLELLFKPPMIVNVPVIHKMQNQSINKH